MSHVSTTYLRLADMTVKVEYRHDHIATLCRDYMIPPCIPDITIALTEEDCLATDASQAATSPGYCEFLSLCRKLCLTFASHGILIFHAAVIEVDGGGYGFFAPSGTGKSTHIRRWRERYGTAVNIVNGDKPFLREIDGVFYAYGSPFCGKEHWQRNVRVPLRALCRIKRAESDSVTPLSPAEAPILLLKQLYLPPDKDASAAVMELADRLLSAVPLYTVSCTPTLHAAEVAHDALLPPSCL